MEKNDSVESLPREDEQIGIEEIIKILPHRYPFLMVDRVLKIEGQRITAIKNVTINEPYFVGHFAEEKLMPGVLMIEALAQTAAILVLKTRGDGRKATFYLASISNAKFRHQVKPGDTLRLEVEATRNSGSRCVFTGRAYVGEQLAASCDFLAMFYR